MESFGEEVKDFWVSEYSSSKDKSKERGFNGVGVMTKREEKRVQCDDEGISFVIKAENREKEWWYSYE